MENLIFQMELGIKESSIPKVNLMETECSTIQLVKYAILEVGKIILFMDLEFYTTRHLKTLKNKLHIGVSILLPQIGAITKGSSIWIISKVLVLYT